MNTPNHTTKCSICDIPLEGEYCHNCGQKSTGKRVRLFELTGDFIAGMFSLERSILATFWLVIRDPQKIVSNYWNGYRKYYHSPGQIAFYAAFFVGLHFALLGKELLGLHMNFTNIPPQFGLLIFMIPLFALSSKILFFKHKRSYLEHLIAMIYLFSTWIVAFLLIDVIQTRVLGNPLDQWMFATFMAINFLWSARVHSTQKKWYFLLLNALMQFIITVIILAAIFFIAYLINPSSVSVT